MIDATELMMGNYIADLNDNTVKLNSIEKGIFSDETLIFCEDNPDPINDITGMKIWYYQLNGFSELWFKPIPLTEEILRLNCGFKVNSNVANLNSIRLIFDTSVEDNIKYWYLAEEDYSGVYGVYTEIKYLHQLQNLYKLLTGETLKITL